MYAYEVKTPYSSSQTQIVIADNYAQADCDFCGSKLKFPCWIRRFDPTSPFHLNPGGLERYCSEICFEMKGLRENIIEGMMDCCNNCGAEMQNLSEVIGREVDEYIMPKIQPLIDGIKQTRRGEHMKADDLVKEIFLRKMDRFGEDTLDTVAHVQTRISVIVTSLEDSHHVQFPKPVTRAQLACMLRDLADAVCCERV